MASLSGQITISVGSPSQVQAKSRGEIAISQSSSSDAISKLAYSSQHSQSHYQNYVPSLATFFGINAKQNEENLYINKSDLIGLSPKLDNTAESLLAALLLRVMKYASGQNSRINITQRNLTYAQINSKTYLRFTLDIVGFIPVSYVDIGSDFSELNFEITSESSDVFTPNNF